MTLTTQFAAMLDAEPVLISIGIDPDPCHALAGNGIQVPESEYIETIIDAIELSDQPDEFRVIRGAIANIKSSVNRASLREMLTLRMMDLGFAAKEGVAV